MKSIPRILLTAAASLLPVSAFAFELTIDRTTYMGGREVPHYEVSGAPKNTLIKWSSWKDEKPTGELDNDYMDQGGFWTDNNGNWEGWGGRWARWAAGRC